MQLNTGPAEGEGWQAVGVGPHGKVRKADKDITP